MCKCACFCEPPVSAGVILQKKAERQLFAVAHDLISKVFPATPSCDSLSTCHHVELNYSHSIDQSVNLSLLWLKISTTYSSWQKKCPILHLRSSELNCSESLLCITSDGKLRTIAPQTLTAMLFMPFSLPLVYKTCMVQESWGTVHINQYFTKRMCAKERKLNGNFPKLSRSRYWIATKPCALLHLFGLFTIC